MEFVTPFITPIVESLMVPVKKHLAFFFSSTKHVTKMNERLQDLNETKLEIEEKKKDALRNDRLIPNRVSGWLEQVETIKEEAETIPTGGNGCWNLKMRYIAGKSSFNILEKIDKLDKKRKEIEWADKQRPLGMVISPSSSSTSEITLNIFPSRKLLLNEVLKLLEADSETQLMSLWGMGGVGKTTMIEDIEKVVKKRGMFKWVVKVSIGTKYDPIATQDAIAKQLDVALTDETKETRAVRLENSFAGVSKSGEKILLIMDDVWEAIKLKDIGLTSPFPKNFKLLITSRNEKVCTKMNIETSSKVFKMVGIEEEEEANSFFWKTVGLSDPDGELCKIGENILNKCSGLPIAIKTIAEALKGEKKDAWKVPHNSLQRHNLNDIDDLKDVVYKIFEISYGYLKKDVDKAIFVLCGLFPDDFDIVLEELVRYGWGLHFFTEANSLDEARKQTSTSVSNLVRANLLTESSTVQCVKMHDLARDFVLNNISEFKQASIVNHGDKCEWPTWEYCERILLTCQGMSEFPQEFYYPNLALLKIMNGNKLLTFPKDFYKPMEKLVVISYDRMWNPLLSVPLQCFGSLRALCLRSCSLVDNDISFLGDLVNLEVLSVSHCGIQKLPSTIRKLKKLKLLDLTGCANLCIDDGVFQNLDKLEELYMRAFAYKPIRFTDANCEELKMLSENLNTLELEFFENILQPKDLSFKTLQRFRISMGCLLEVKNEYTKEHYSFKNTLALKTNRSDLLESKINQLFSKTEELHLSVEDMSYIDNISMPLSQSSTISNLKVLHVFECPDLTHLFTIQVANGLRQLESLTVSSCHVLTSLVSLSNSVNIIELPQLVELKLYDLPNFTSIIHENDISATQLLFNKEVVFPKLLNLTVNCLKKLKQIWACDITSREEDNFSMLRKIVLVGCDSLVNLFPRNPMRLLSHLEELNVEKCCSIEVLFNIDLGEIVQHRSSSSSLRRIEVSELEELTEVWRINEENNSGDLIRGFQNVETIKIKGCKNYKYVFTHTSVNFDTGALMDIYISFDDRDAKITHIANDSGNIPIVACPSYQLTHTFHQLRKIKFIGFERVKVMFEMECPSISGDLMATRHQQPLPLLPCLEELQLWSMDTLSHVWKCNKWNGLFILHKEQVSSSFKNLTTIHLYYCKSLKYLFSPLMSKLISNLKIVVIGHCEGMEEVVSNRDDEEEDEVLPTCTTPLFPSLENLYLSDLKSLKQIGGVLSKRKTNVIHDQLKFSLSSAIPSYSTWPMDRLQKLTISDCNSMVMMFESKEINNNGYSSSIFDQRSSPLQGPECITLYHDLTNLKDLSIYMCYQLEYLFIFSTLESLKNLESLTINDCEAMKVIVREENGKESSKVVLPRLKSINLVALPNIEGFFLGKNVDFDWPSLDYVVIDKCPQMMVFTPRASNLKYIHTSLGKHNLECGLNYHDTPSPSSESSSMGPSYAKRTPWSFYNLIEVFVSGNMGLSTIVPSNELPHLQNLEKVYVAYANQVEEIFEEASELTNIESQTIVIFPKLREVKLILLNLKYIWKSNQWRRLEFPNLTRLEIYGCLRLEYVFTPFMVGTLLKLQELDIEECPCMEVIVGKDEECDAKVEEIMFPCLKSIKLKNLKSLKGFCMGKENLTLALLNTLEIYKCPKIRIFSEEHSITPELKLVETSFGLFHAGEDINCFIMTKKREGNIFGERVPPSDEDESPYEDE